jgi:hypothetical protein
VIGLSDPDLRQLVRENTARDAREPFGAYLFATEDPGADIARHVEQNVFLEAFGNTDDLLAHEYGRYEASSFFICIVDHLRRVPAGAMRVLTPSPAGFKSLDDIEGVWGCTAGCLIENTGLALDASCTWDIATLAVAEEYRRGASSGVVTMGMYQTLTLAAFHCGIDWFVAILDMPVFRILRWRLRMIFAGYEGIGPLPYLGSAASLPAWCDVTRAERRLAEEDEDLHSVLCRGVGLEPALRPIDLATADRYVVRGQAAAGGLLSS